MTNESELELELERIAKERETQLKKIEEEEERLKNKLKAIRRNKPVEFVFFNHNNDLAVFRIHTENIEDHTESINKLRREYHVTQTYYASPNEFQISLDHFQSLLAYLEKKPNVEVTFKPSELEKNIKEIITRPEWIVTTYPAFSREVNAIDEKDNEELDKLIKEVKSIIIKPGRKADTQKVYNVIGNVAKWNYEEKEFSVHQIDAWRVFHFLHNLRENGKTYTLRPLAEKIIKDSIERRSKLEEVLGKEDTDLDFEFPTQWARDNNFKLLPYQKVCVKALELAGGNLIVADEVGLGKTIESIAYALHIKSKKNVVICPNSLKLNWKKHIINLTGVKPLFLHAMHPDREAMIWLIKNSPEWIIINPEILERWTTALNLFQPSLIIADEAHYYKNTDTKRTQAYLDLHAPKIIPMTGTPVVNRPTEIWTSLNKISPTQFAYKQTFEKRYTTANGKLVINAKELRENLRPLMIRRTKKDVLKDLPPIRRIQHDYELSPKAKKLYDKALIGLYQAIGEYDPHGRKEIKEINNILVRMMRLKQICALDKAREYTPDLCTELNDSSYNEEDPNKNKVIIFTQFKPVAYAISRRLGNEALSSVELMNNRYETIDVSSRFRLVEEFQSDKEKRYLVTTMKSMGEGLDITAALHTVFNDLGWTPKDHIQAEGRAYGRVSDLHTIDSRYIVASGTIEEDILRLLAVKKYNINEVVEMVNDREERDESMSIFKELVAILKEKGL